MENSILSENSKLNSEEIDQLNEKIKEWWRRYYWIYPSFHIIIKFLAIIFLIGFASSAILLIVSFFNQNIAGRWYEYLMLSFSFLILFNHMEGAHFLLYDAQQLSNNVIKLVAFFSGFSNITFIISWLGFIHYNEILLDNSIVSLVGYLISIFLGIISFMEFSYEKNIAGEIFKLSVNSFIKNFNKDDDVSE